MTAFRLHVCRKALPGLRKRPRCRPTACPLQCDNGPVATPGGPYGKTKNIRIFAMMSKRIVNQQYTKNSKKRHFSGRNYGNQRPSHLTHVNVKVFMMRLSHIYDVNLHTLNAVPLFGPHVQRCHYPIREQPF